MRITNKMMTNNMMGNINNNKFSMTKLEQQYSTGKKIQKPSEDPIVAVRALKLRTNLSELEQYYDKNIPDAKSWMDVTESALSTVNEILSKINTYCNQGSSDTLTATDRKAIVDNLQEMKAQMRQEGNTNYAGRYVFTGYKTDTPLIFNETTENLDYSITEEFKGTDLLIGTKVVGSYELSDYSKIPVETFAQAPTLTDIYRIQLSYDNLQKTAPDNIKYSKFVGGELQAQLPLAPITSMSILDDLAYQPGPDAINYIPETGELILGKNVYDVLKSAETMNVTYGKTKFEEDDLRPEHYFDCTVTDTNNLEADPIAYTKKNEKGINVGQDIQYEINFNQKLTINTEGEDAITHKIGRDIDEILNQVNEVIATENKIVEIKERLEDTNLTTAESERYKKMLEQVNTELVLKKDAMQTAFSIGMKCSSDQQDMVNTAVADLGSRYVRLELTESRLSSQKVDFEDLLSNNEDADLVETYIKFSAAETIYNASLNAASKVVQNTLLDFL